MGGAEVLVARDRSAEYGARPGVATAGGRGRRLEPRVVVGGGGGTSAVLALCVVEQLKVVGRRRAEAGRGCPSGGPGYLSSSLSSSLTSSSPL